MHFEELIIKVLLSNDMGELERLLSPIDFNFMDSLNEYLKIKGVGPSKLVTLLGLNLSVNSVMDYKLFKIKSYKDIVAMYGNDLTAFKKDIFTIVFIYYGIFDVSSSLNYFKEFGNKVKDRDVVLKRIKSYINSCRDKLSSPRLEYNRFKSNVLEFDESMNLVQIIDRFDLSFKYKEHLFNLTKFFIAAEVSLINISAYYIGGFPASDILLRTPDISIEEYSVSELLILLRSLHILKSLYLTSSLEKACSLAPDSIFKLIDRLYSVIDEVILAFNQGIDWYTR